MPSPQALSGSNDGNQRQQERSVEGTHRDQGVVERKTRFRSSPISCLKRAETSCLLAATILTELAHIVPGKGKKEGSCTFRHVKLYDYGIVADCEISIKLLKTLVQSAADVHQDVGMARANFPPRTVSSRVSASTAARSCGS